MALSFQPEASDSHVTASCQQHGAAFVDDSSVGEDGLHGFMEDSQSLPRDAQHQLEEEEIQSPDMVMGLEESQIISVVHYL